MSYNEILSDISISISISESNEMESLGLSLSHLNDAMVEVARHLLALGAKLVYGGDLRQNGFSQLLFELVQRHSSDSILEGSSDSVKIYLAWPVHCQYSIDDIGKIREELLGTASLLYLSRHGTLMSWDERKATLPVSPTPEEWIAGLTSMRKLSVESTHAKVVLGGKTNNFFGVMPGVAEESLLALKIKQPIYVVGGFGGCALDIAKEIGLISSAVGSSNWDGAEKFSPFNFQSLNNGLNFDENLTLAKTPHIDEISVLIMKGLSNLRNSELL